MTSQQCKKSHLFQPRISYSDQPWLFQIGPTMRDEIFIQLFIKIVDISSAEGNGKIKKSLLLLDKRNNLLIQIMSCAFSNICFWKLVVMCLCLKQCSIDSVLTPLHFILTERQGPEIELFRKNGSKQNNTFRTSLLYGSGIFSCDYFEVKIVVNG